MIKEDNGLSAGQGEYAVLSYDEETDDRWARRFVRERVVPPDRQNIGMIMREVGMTYYSEFPLLVYTSERCAMDEFYIEEIGA